jgi:hypothetical protein
MAGGAGQAERGQDRGGSGPSRGSASVKHKGKASTTGLLVRMGCRILMTRQWELFAKQHKPDRI